MTTKMLGAEADTLLTPGEVANMFHVDPKTVTRWAKEGKIIGIKTPGGHRRFRKSDVDDMLRGKDLPGQTVNVEKVREFVHWLVALDDPANVAERRVITLAEIINRARDTLA